MFPGGVGGELIRVAMRVAEVSLESHSTDVPLPACSLHREENLLKKSSHEGFTPFRPPPKNSSLHSILW